MLPTLRGPWPRPALHRHLLCLPSDTQRRHADMQVRSDTGPIISTSGKAECPCRPPEGADEPLRWPAETRGAPAQAGRAEADGARRHPEAAPRHRSAERPVVWSEPMAAGRRRGRFRGGPARTFPMRSDQGCRVPRARGAAVVVRWLPAAETKAATLGSPCKAFDFLRKLERAMRFELTTLTLARLCSTPELRPLPSCVRGI